MAQLSEAQLQALSAILLGGQPQTRAQQPQSFMQNLPYQYGQVDPATAMQPLPNATPLPAGTDPRSLLTLTGSDPILDAQGAATPQPKRKRRQAEMRSYTPGDPNIVTQDQFRAMPPSERETLMEQGVPNLDVPERSYGDQPWNERPGMYLSAAAQGLTFNRADEGLEYLGFPGAANAVNYNQQALRRDYPEGAFVAENAGNLVQGGLIAKGAMMAPKAVAAARSMPLAAQMLMGGAAGGGQAWLDATGEEALPEDQLWARTALGATLGTGVAGVRGALDPQTPMRNSPDTVYSVGGPTAKKADLAKLAKAQSMLDEGEDMVDIEKATGWLYNPTDRQWSFEISDHNARLTPKAAMHLEDARMLNRPATLKGKAGDWIHHPELYDNYPQLRDMPMEMRADPYGGIAGNFDPDTRTAMMQAGNGVEMLDTGLHEIGGHAAMAQEGRIAGGNRSMFAGIPLVAKRRAVRGYETIYNEMLAAGAERRPMRPDIEEMWKGIGSPSLDDLRDNLKFWRTIAQQTEQGVYNNTYSSLTGMKKPASVVAEEADRYAADNMYDKFEFGENFARNVEARRTMTPEQRANIPFSQTFDWKGGAPIDQHVKVPSGYGFGYAGKGQGWDGNPNVPKGFKSDPRPRPGMGHNGGPQMPQYKLNRNGDIVGAPPGMKTAADVRALQDEWIAMTQDPAGLPVRNFYGDSADTVAAHTSDPAVARKWAIGMGDTSPLTDVDTNISKTATAMNQDTLGMPVDLTTGVGARQQGPRLQADWAADQMPAGPKTGPYSHNMISGQFPQPEDPQLPVMDTWMGRAAGYPMEEMGGGLKPNNVKFLNEHVMPRVMDETGLDYKQAQAHIWEVQRQRAGDAPQMPIPDLFEGNQSFTQVEAMPGATTGFDAGRKLSMAEREDITNRMMGAGGEENLSRIFGMSPKPEPGYGSFDGQINPNRKMAVMTGSEGQGAAKTLDAASQKVAQLHQYANQLIYGQDASGLTSPRYLPKSGSKTRANIVYVDLGERLGGKGGHDRVFDALKAEFGDDWGGKTFQAPHGKGMILKNISDMPNTEFQKAVDRVNQRLGGKGTKLMYDAFGDYTAADWQKGEYKQLLQAFDTPKGRELFDKMKPLFSAKQQAWEKISKDYGFKPGLIDQFRNIASRHGYQGVLDAIKDGILPAGALGFFFAVAKEQDSET